MQLYIIDGLQLAYQSIHNYNMGFFDKIFESTKPLHSNFSTKFQVGHPTGHPNHFPAGRVYLHLTALADLARVAQGEVIKTTFHWPPGFIAIYRFTLKLTHMGVNPKIGVGPSNHPF